MSISSEKANKSRLRELSEEFERLEKKLKLGGGAAKIEKIHRQGKLTARERVDLLFDKDAYQQEIGLLVAYDEYDGKLRRRRLLLQSGKFTGAKRLSLPMTRRSKRARGIPKRSKKFFGRRKLRCEIACRSFIWLIRRA